MYIPPRFRVEERTELVRFLNAHPFASIVSATGTGLTATHLPFLIDEEEDAIVLRSHLARANPHWKHFGAGEALVIFQGADAYISPGWYSQHPSVPTWDYTAVHAYGTPQLVEGDGLRETVLRMVKRFEADEPEEWKPDLPPAYLEGMLKAIVGVEIRVTRIEGKYKLSQNRSEEEQVQVIHALKRRADGKSREVAEEMERLLKSDATM